MSKWRAVRNASTGELVLARVRLCDTVWTRFRGLQFVRHLPADQGLLFVTGGESRTNTSIHMLFMFFSIAVVWMDAEGKVVDKRLAKPWRLAYAPQSPAQYFIEANPDLLNRVKVGDILKFDETAQG